MSNLEARYKEILTEVCFEYQPKRPDNWLGWLSWRDWMIDKGFAKKLGLRTK